MFIAIPVPAVVGKKLEKLDPQVEGLRWTAVENMHLTLCFVGNVEEETEKRLRTALKQVKAPAFPLEVRTLGCFGGRGGFVVWAGVDDPENALQPLRAQITEVAKSLDLQVDRKFRPHVTLARSRRLQPRDVRGSIACNSKQHFGKFTVKAFTLFSSELHPDGAVYQKELRVPLN